MPETKFNYTTPAGGSVVDKSTNIDHTQTRPDEVDAGEEWFMRATVDGNVSTLSAENAMLDTIQLKRGVFPADKVLSFVHTDFTAAGTSLVIGDESDKFVADLPIVIRQLVGGAFETVVPSVVSTTTNTLTIPSTLAENYGAGAIVEQFVMTTDFLCLGGVPGVKEQLERLAAPTALTITGGADQIVVDTLTASASSRAAYYDFLVLTAEITDANLPINYMASVQDHTDLENLPTLTTYYNLTTGLLADMSTLGAVTLYVYPIAKDSPGIEGDITSSPLGAVASDAIT